MKMKNDAIQTDADTDNTVVMPVIEEEKSLEGIPTPADRRMEAMERIEAGRLAELSSESGIALDEQLAVQTNNEAPAPENERKFSVKVDGEELEVSESDLIKGFQKNTTASKRLEQAAEKQKELTAREAALAERERNLLTKVPGAEQRAGELPASDIDGSLPSGDDAIKDFLMALYEGDEEKTADKLRKLLQGRQEQPAIPDVDALVGKVKNQITADAAMEQFGKSYKEIVADPILSQVADGFLESGLSNGKTFAEALEEAGQKTRAWVKDRALGLDTPTPTKPNRESRRERKEQMDTLTPVNIAAGGASEPVEPNASDTIREMRQARGLNT